MDYLAEDLRLAHHLIVGYEWRAKVKPLHQLNLELRQLYELFNALVNLLFSDLK